MSRITETPAVGVLNPWASTNNNPNLSSSLTATVAVSTQAFSANPATGTQPSSGTGFYDASFCTYVGQKFLTSDGRELTLVVNGTAAIASGKLVASPAEVTAFEGLSMTVPAATPATAGSTQILVTNGATVLNQNQYQGGYLITASGTGPGQMFKISSHAAAAASATFIVNLEDPIQTTLDATTKVHLQYNPYGVLNAGVIVSPTTQTGAPIGVTLTSLAASTAGTFNATSGLQTANGTSQYGMIVSHGPTACLIDNTVTNVGYPLGPSAATAGSLGVATLTSKPQCAISGQTQVSAQYGIVYMQL